MTIASIATQSSDGLMRFSCTMTEKLPISSGDQRKCIRLPIGCLSITVIDTLNTKETIFTEVV